MKKSLVVTLALVFVLGIAGTAFAAANPFVDVPAKHWAYDAVAKLANAGVVDGYNDGTFRGDKTMTRYEMAQIVAKAMVKSEKADAETKALVDKLAVEFNAELQNLGVRVAKLEKNASSIKFTGDARIRWNDDEALDNSKFYERFRINMTADVNENTTFNGRFAMNHNEQGTTGSDDAKVAIAAFTTKDVFNTGVTSTIGRYAEFLGQTGYLVDTTGTGLVDGAKITAGNALKVTVGYADFAAFDPDKAAEKNAADEVTKVATQGVKDAVYAEVKYNTSKATNLNATYFETKGQALRNVDYSIIGAGFTTKFAKDWALTGDYFQNGDVAGDPEAYVARISYKGANKSVPQSWGTFVEYFNWETYATPVALSGANMILASSDRTPNSNLNEGVKGFGLGVTYTLAKNILLEGFQTFNSEYTDSKADTDNERTRIQVNFFF